jgi:hypothetical protein
MPTADSILLPGTQRRWDVNQGQGEVQKFSHTNHFEIAFRSGKGTLTNRSKGVSVLLRHGKFHPKDVKEIKTPPAKLQGRAGYIRIISSKCDINSTVAYLPPKSDKDKFDVESVQKTMDVVEKWMLQTPTRSTPSWITMETWACRVMAKFIPLEKATQWGL